MSFKRLSYKLLLTLGVLLIGFVAGCGGGGEQSGDQQGNGSESQQQEGASGGGAETSEAGSGTGGEDGAPEARMALGTIGVVNLDKNKFTLRPTDGERTVFRLRENTRITLDGQEATPEDIKRGQQAQVRYVTRNERNVAREVSLFSAEGDSGGGGTGG